MELVLWFGFIYLMQMMFAAFFNAWNKTRIPKNGIDFIKLTFLPYVLLNMEEISVK